MKHLELFSGIGGFRRALDLLSIDDVMHFDCVGYSEIDDKAMLTYCSNFDTMDELVMGDIAKFTSDSEKMKSIPQFDLLTGGFPCQTFSSMGSLGGFEDFNNPETRGQMFFRIMDVVNHSHPRFLVLENVKNLSTHDHGNTIARIELELHNAGYIVHRDVFNTSEFGLPQTRNRTIIVARRQKLGDFEFSESQVKQSFDCLNHQQCSLDFYENTLSILEKSVDKKYYLSQRIKPTILSDGTAGFKSNSEIDKLTARTLTASMHKMHRACQDNYFSDKFILSDGQDRPSTYMTKEELAQIDIRKITPQEAFKLQGFPSQFVNRAKAAGVSDGSLYKQAGNAVSVNMIYAVFYYLISKKIIFE